MRGPQTISKECNNNQEEHDLIEIRGRIVPPDHIFYFTVNLLKLAPFYLANHLKGHQLLLGYFRMRGSTSLHTLLEALSDIALDCEILLKDCSPARMFLDKRREIVLDALVDNLIHLILHIDHRNMLHYQTIIMLVDSALFWWFCGRVEER